MKKCNRTILAALLALGILMGCSSTSVKKQTYKPGTYTSTQRGMVGNFEVIVTFSEDAIESVTVGPNEETLMLGTEAIRILGDRAVKYQSLKLDVVSGATFTSMGVIAGIRDCVNQAGGNIYELLKIPVPVDTYANLPKKADIIIVGGGIAGVTTAISAKQAGGDVILLEKNQYLGGNSTLASGTFIFGGSSYQQALGIKDDPDTFYNWALANSNNKKEAVHVRTIADHGQELIDWFASFGVGFNRQQVNPTDGSPVPRGHAMSPSMGAGFSTMVNYMERLGVDVRYGTKVEDFILDNSGQIAGVKGKDYYGNPVEYYGNKVVIASGGFADNPDAIAKYWGEEWRSLVYGGSKGMDGTMIWAAINLGADTQDMDDVHIDAMLEVTRAMTLSSNLLRCGGILVRQSTAQRFADEQANHSEDAAAEMHRLGDPYFWLIVDDHLFSYSEAITAKARGFLKMGIVGTYNSIQEISDATGMDNAALTRTINEYAGAAKAGVPDRFGRDRFFQGLNVTQEMKPPYYVFKVSNGVAVTTGGLKVNKDMQVLDESGKPIPRLWAVGEAVGGYTIHYVGGDALSHAAINGMLVGRALAE